MKKIIILLVIISTIIICIYCNNKSKKYISNLYGDKIEITDELNSGVYELIDSSQIIKFINNKANITEVEKKKVFLLLESDSVKQNQILIKYSYSYFIDKEVVDVFIIKFANKKQNYFVRKLENELIFPIETDQDIWEK